MFNCMLIKLNINNIIFKFNYYLIYNNNYLF